MLAPPNNLTMPAPPPLQPNSTSPPPLQPNSTSPPPLQPNSTSPPLPATSSLLLHTVNFSDCVQFTSSCNFSASRPCTTGPNSMTPAVQHSQQHLTCHTPHLPTLLTCPHSSPAHTPHLTCTQTAPHTTQHTQHTQHTHTTSHTHTHTHLTLHKLNPHFCSSFKEGATPL